MKELLLRISEVTQTPSLIRTIANYLASNTIPKLAIAVVIIYLIAKTLIFFL